MYKNISIKIKKSLQELVIHKTLLEDISQYMQTGNKPESGGLLFAEFKLPKIIVKKASFPNKSDYQCRYEFRPDQERQQKIINLNYKKGLHYIGEWHTHPENIPTPSILDITSMKETFIKSKHELNFFLLLIIGNKISNDMFWIGMQNATNTINLLKRKTDII